MRDRLPMTGNDWSRVMAVTDGELLACWRALALGEPPVDLEMSIPETVEQAAVEYAIALDQLHLRGLIGNGAPSPDLEEALRVLSGAPIGLELRLSDGLIVLGALDGGRGAVLVIDDAHDPGLFLRPVYGANVPRTLVDLVGPLNPGRVSPVRIPADLLDEARDAVEDGSWWTLADELIVRGVTQADAQSLALMCSDISSSGQLTASAWHGGAERPGGWALGFHRSITGDFLQVRRPDEAGRECVTIFPITTRELLGQLTELVAALLTE